MGRVIEMPLPRLGETMDEGRIGLIVKKPGEAFRRGETLLEVESDKTTVEVPALQDGILVEWLVSPDQMVPVDSAIARIEIEGEAVAEAKAPAVAAVAVMTPAPAPAAFRPPPVQGSTRPRASTAARAAARRAGADLALVAGTGRNGRVTRADLAAATRPARATYLADTPHGKIFCREWAARGTPRGEVLLLHGLFGESQSFTTFGRKFAAQGFRTTALDLPGHGESESAAATLDEIVDAVRSALPAERMHIVAHSLGAVVAARLLGRALSLTILAPAGCGEEINTAFIDAMLAGDVDRAMPLLGERVPLEAQALLGDHLSRRGGQLRAIAAAVAQEGRQTVSILSALAAAKCPVQAVFLRDDAIIPAHHALNMPFNVQVRIMPGASHLPHWRDPDAIVRAVAEAARVR